MTEFAEKHIALLKNKQIIIFCSQLIFSGDGARSFMDIFPRDWMKVIYAEHFFMPNNINNLFILPLAGEKKIKKYMANADRKMKIVCQNIKDGIVKKRGFNKFSRILGLMQGAFVPKLEKKALGSVMIGDDCTQCLLCISICPMKNLEYENGNIIHKNNCTICYRCINKCPHKAIRLFFTSKVKKQYKGLN